MPSTKRSSITAHQLPEERNHHLARGLNRKPSYAEEILTPEFGMGLEGLIASRGSDLYGIVNGIDADVWNPASDSLLRQATRPRR